MRFHSKLNIKAAFAVILALTCFPLSAAAEQKDVTIAGLSVAEWLPDNPDGAPVVIFSHGFHGCNTQSKFLTQALADAGYAVFAPNHQDAACRNLEKWFTHPEELFRKAGNWTSATYQNRHDDIENLLNALEADPAFKKLDWKHVGMSGHSLGGYTALAMGGAWPAWKDKRFKAVLALSPYAAPFILQHTLSGIDMPVMYQGGTRDIGITPKIVEKDGAYDQTPAPKFYIEFGGASHIAWTDLMSGNHDAIDHYSIAFFDHYLKGKPFPPGFEKKQDGVTEVRIEK